MPASSGPPQLSPRAAWGPNVSACGRRRAALCRITAAARRPASLFPSKTQGVHKCKSVSHAGSQFSMTGQTSTRDLAGQRWLTWSCMHDTSAFLLRICPPASARRVAAPHQAAQGALDAGQLADGARRHRGQQPRRGLLLQRQRRRRQRRRQAAEQLGAAGPVRPQQHCWRGRELGGGHIASAARRAAHHGGLLHRGRQASERGKFQRAARLPAGWQHRGRHSPGWRRGQRGQLQLGGRRRRQHARSSAGHAACRRLGRGPSSPLLATCAACCVSR